MHKAWNKAFTLAWIFGCCASLVSTPLIMPDVVRQPWNIIPMTLPQISSAKLKWPKESGEDRIPDIKSSTSSPLVPSYSATIPAVTFSGKSFWHDIFTLQCCFLLSWISCSVKPSSLCYSFKTGWQIQRINDTSHLRLL